MKKIFASIAITALLTNIVPVIATSEVIEPDTELIKSTTSIQIEKVSSEPKIEPKTKESSWQENPNNCEPDRIRADNLECLPDVEPVAEQPSLVASTATGTCEDYRHLVEQYDWNVDTMMYAMTKESGCNSNAVGDDYVINGVYAPSCGLLQVRTLPGRPSCEALKNPATNIATAYQIWLGQSYQAWTVLH